MPPVKTEAFVLRKYNFRETSVLLDLYTRHTGRIRGILKGVRVPKSRVTPLSFSPGSHVAVIIYPRRSGLYLIHHPVTTEDFLSDDRRAMRVWRIFLGIVNLFTPEKEHSAEIFALLMQAGNLIVRGPSHTIGFVGSKMKLVRLLGYGVELQRCVVCGSGTGLRFFSGKLGGVLCGACTGREPRPLPLSLKVLRVMRYLDRVPVRNVALIKIIPSDLLEKINYYLNVTLHYHTELKDIWWNHENGIFSTNR